MKSKLAPWFWVEAVMSLATGLALVLILVRKDWIEAIVPIDPDQHSGTLELLIAVLLGVLTISFIVLARYEWLRAHPAADRK